VTIEGLLFAALGYFVPYFLMTATVGVWRRRRAWA
jgi:hypothetical protein